MTIVAQCPVCNGTGRLDRTEGPRCTACQGSGLKKVRAELSPAPGRYTLWHCTACGHEVASPDGPPPVLRWDDGHVCSFERSSAFLVVSQEAPRAVQEAPDPDGLAREFSDAQDGLDANLGFDGDFDNVYD